MPSPEPLIGRYRFVRRLKGTSKSLIWLAVDEVTGREAVASVLSPTRADGLIPVVGLVHPHLARIHEVLSGVEPRQLPATPFASEIRVAIADHVPGRTLHDRVETAKVAPARAVQWAERLADVLVRLHEAGGIHGALSPRAVVVSRVQHGKAPVLTSLVVQPSGAFCSPERVTGGGPTAEDDVWALVATLYASLARRPPFHGRNRTELADSILQGRVDALAEHGVDDELGRIIERGFSRKREERFSGARDLRAALRQWMEEHEVPDDADLSTWSAPPAPAAPGPSDDSVLVAALDLDRIEAAAALAPSPTPPGVDASPVVAAEVAASAGEPAGGQAAPPRIVARTAVDERPQGFRHATLGAALVLVAVLGGGAYVLTTQGRPAPHAQASGESIVRPAAAPASALAHSVAPPATPSPGPSATAARIVPAAEDPNACIQGLLPEGTFGRNPQLEFFCKQTDLWTISRQMYQEVAKRQQGSGMELWVYLARFEMPAVAMLRNACCGGAAPFTAIVPKTDCGPLTAMLTDLAAQPSAPVMDRYSEAVDCLAQRQVRHPGWWKGVPAKDSRGRFEQFLSQFEKARAR